MPERVIPGEADIVSRCRAITRPGSYMILPQANRVPSTLPNLRDAHAQVLATPQLGARFVQHELLMQPGGGTIKPVDDRLEHFFFVLEGKLLVDVEGRSDIGGGTVELEPGQGTVVPRGVSHRPRAPERTVVLMLEPATVVATGD